MFTWLSKSALEKTAQRNRRSTFGLRIPLMGNRRKFDPQVHILDITTVADYQLSSENLQKSYFADQKEFVNNQSLCYERAICHRYNCRVAQGLGFCNRFSPFFLLTFVQLLQ